MRITTAIPIIVLAGHLAAAPLKEKPATPITPANVQQLREIAFLLSKREAIADQADHRHNDQHRQCGFEFV